MEYFELDTIYDSRKSFYGKAHVTTTGNTMYLTSYSTVVAKAVKNSEGGYTILDPDNDTELDLKHPGWSQTTNRHIREFAEQIKNGYLTV